MHAVLPGDTAIWLSNIDDHMDVGLHFAPHFCAMLTRVCQTYNFTYQRSQKSFFLLMSPTNTRSGPQKRTLQVIKLVCKKVVLVSLLRGGSKEVHEKVGLEGLSWLLKSSHLILYTFVSHNILFVNWVKSILELLRLSAFSTLAETHCRPSTWIIRSLIAAPVLFEPIYTQWSFCYHCLLSLLPFSDVCSLWNLALHYVYWEE